MWNLDTHGFEIRDNFISEAQITSIVSEVNAYSSAAPKHGIRNAEKKFASIATLTTSPRILETVSTILSKTPKLVRVIFFDKTPDKNWLVTWHQDKTVTLNAHVDLPGWGPWSIKEDTYHVQPPVEVLNQMLTLRLHLDAADEQNGCLKVVPGSHRIGILSQAEIEQIVARESVVACSVSAGAAVLMRPHLLHSSSKSIQPKHRRVVHIEFSNYELPQGLSWET
ncbi:phytanoyl-CoA dioxygenase family protein [Kaarinaea lacus]